MKIASSLTQADSLEQAVDECIQPIQAALDQVDLLFVFASSSWSSHLQTLIDAIHANLSPRHVIGCTGESIVGRRTEVEWSPALALWGAQLPGVDLEVQRLQYESTPDGGSFHGWTSDEPDRSGSTSDRSTKEAENTDDARTYFLVGDPYTFPADLFIHHLAESEGSPTPILGGMASGGEPGSIRVVTNDQVYDSGAALLSVRGPVRIESLVSQGCRPVGEPFVITRSERNIVFELGGKPAAEQLDKVFREAANREQQLMQRGLQLGRVISEYQDRFEQGDFLVRGVSGVQEDGSLVIGDYVRTGQTVQFHVRDAETADAELREMLAAKKDLPWSGALAFTCNGRGTRLFPSAHHDARVIGEALGDPPLAGFFAQGEIGPVGGRNFVHGYTASIALWREL